MNKAPLPSPKSSSTATARDVASAANPTPNPPHAAAAAHPSPVAAAAAAAAAPIAHSSSHSSPHRPPVQHLPHSTYPFHLDAGPGAAHPHPHPRPPLHRHADATESDLSDSAARHDGQSGQESIEQSGDEDPGHAPTGEALSGEMDLERLRALQRQMLQQQQQQQRHLRSANSSRVSPIREEPAQSMSGSPASARGPTSAMEPMTTMSPTLEGAFASSPLATGHTTSTESTESAKTIRGGSVPPTPGSQSLRTPSYPFPTVPNTPKNWPWPSSVHQPFMSLSPTVPAMYQKDVIAPRDHIGSETSTPIPSSAPFVPGGQPEQNLAPHDPRYPSPSLYDLVLRLGSEPGLAAWWQNVTAIMHDCYGAQRATLAVPADASDIENVPWGQKTTFTIIPRELLQQHEEREASRRDNHKAPITVQEPTPQESPVAAPKPMPIQRPQFPTRHSFAGHERQKMDVLPEASAARGVPVRPLGPRRTASHVPQPVTREHPLRQVSPVSFDGSPRDTATPVKATFSDPEFSEIGGDASAAPPTAVFPVLRALDHEPDALIDNTGVSRVLERGRLVTLTRDYSTSVSTPSRSTASESVKDETLKGPHRQATTSEQDFPKVPDASYRPGHATKSGEKSDHLKGDQPHVRYEEYEQFPTSPWAQSPAPSPAIQNDPNENPFFAADAGGGNVVEETFSPTGSNPDYTRFDVVQAIGIDRASTVTHIPFIHPTLSQPMYSPDSPSQTPSSSARSPDDQTERGGTSSTSEYLRKAPIAILSLLSPIVPYPRNLTDSLKLLAPHLATSFSNAWQFSNAQAQAIGYRNRRFVEGVQVGLHPSDQEGLGDLLHLDLENIDSSATGSMTSPSDYSGRSKYSPGGGSMGGTPAWDPSSMGFSSKHSVGSTPAHLSGSDAVEGYFDAKKRSTRTSHSTSQENMPRKSSTSDHRSAKRPSTSIPIAEALADDVATPRHDKGQSQSAALYEAAGQMSAQRKTRSGPPHVTHHRAHSLLHSYGADFSSSFQSLPAATTPGAKPSTHMRGAPYPDGPEMPPPSESLLRTIIDSLPVQIFTALPTTGALTWVNSKFLVYRGQDSRQVLQDPWDSIHDDDKPGYLDQWNQSLRTGQQLQRKVRLQRFDGHYRWFYVRVAPLKNKRQQIVHWIGTNMDFHEQHLAELNSSRQQETAASEAKYRALANSSPQIVFVVSNRRGLSFCNSQWITYSGQSEAEAHGNGFLEYVHPDDVVKCKLPEMSEDGFTPTNVPTSMPPDHGRHSSNSSEESLSDTEKAVTSPGSASPDRLEMPQAKLSKLADTGILRVTRDASGRASYSTEVRLRSKDGEYRWHLVRILLENALAEDGEEETWYGTATDINDHKLLEQTLKETMDAKTRFLSNMSHEIRTPLNGISGMVNFLLDSPLLTEQLEHVNIMKASTDSLLNLINDILDLSKVEAGMIKLDMGWLHLPSLLEEVNDLNMGLAIQKGLELNYLVDEGVPSMVKGDKFRIRQVMLNVVGNAIKFTEKGEIFVRCRPCPPDRNKPLADDEFMVRFEVIDTGKGFNEEEAKYLFKRFSQIDASSTRQHGGTGLGLAISMQFVELHGGKMDARSVPNKGSTFFFNLKFGMPTDTDRPPISAQVPGTPALEVATTPLLSPSPVQKPLQSQVAVAILTERKSSSSVSSERSDSLKSPVPSLTSSDRTRISPSLSSAGSSNPSLAGISLTGNSSIRSEQSSAASSLLQETHISKDQTIRLALPNKRPGNERDPHSDDSSASINSEVTIRANDFLLPPLASSLPPPMYSILVVCPLIHSREATIRHIKNTLPQGIPHQVTGESSLMNAQRMIGGDDPVLFTHIVLVLHVTAEIIAMMDQILSLPAHEKTAVIVVSDPARKRELLKDAPAYDYEQLYAQRRLQFIYRPLKPSKFALIFDPQKERESSTDRNQNTAQQVVVSQKLVFEDLKRRVGDKGHKVLLVEDNKINQTVVLKFLDKIAVDTETVLDGVQCTDAVFSKEPGHYSIILCDLHMPNKDGYQACKEIRRWEKKKGYRRHPIIALSANVLGDVYAKCVEAGFNSYVTKPVDFKDLSRILAKFLDPDDATKPPEFMTPR